MCWSVSKWFQKLNCDKIRKNSSPFSQYRKFTDISKSWWCIMQNFLNLQPSNGNKIWVKLVATWFHSCSDIKITLLDQITENIYAPWRQRRIWNSIRHLRWDVFAKIFAKRLHIDIRLGSKYAPEPYSWSVNFCKGKFTITVSFQLRHHIN